MKNKKYKPVASLLVIAEQLRKILFFIIFLGGLFSPLTSTAAGLVPCGGEGEDPCTLCHFFLMFQNIIDFVMFTLVPVVAVFMLVIAGIMFMMHHLGGAELLPGGARGGPAMLSQARRLITSVIIGLVIIYAAWIIINTFFVVIGVAEWTGLKEGWFSIDCTIPP